MLDKFTFATNYDIMYTHRYGTNTTAAGAADVLLFFGFQIQQFHNISRSEARGPLINHM